MCVHLFWVSKERHKEWCDNPAPIRGQCIMSSLDLGSNHKPSSLVPRRLSHRHGKSFSLPGWQETYVFRIWILKRLRLAATTLGADVLGFTAKEIGLHSARSGAAMAMYLAHVPVFTIMLLGRWSSDAFLRYIHKQVKEFSTGISAKMVQHDHFFTVPSTSKDDPRVSNHPLNLALQNNNGLCSFKGTVRPLASVFHWLLASLFHW